MPPLSREVHPQNQTTYFVSNLHSQQSKTVSPKKKRYALQNQPQSKTVKETEVALKCHYSDIVQSVKKDSIPAGSFSKLAKNVKEKYINE